VSRVDSVGIAKQTAVGTKNVTAEYFPPVESADSDYNRDEIVVEETIGHRHPTPLDYGLNFWKVKMKGAPRYASLPRILSMHCGLPVTTTPDVTNAPTARSHLFSLTSTLGAPKEHSIYLTRRDPVPAINDLFYDCYGDDIEFSIAAGEVLKFESTAVAPQIDSGQSVPTATLDATSRVRFHEVVVGLSVDGGGEVVTKCGSASIKLGNNIDTDQKILGSKQLDGISPGNTDLDVQFEVMDKTLLQAWYNRNLQANPAVNKVRITGTGAVIGGAITYKFEMIAYACEITDAPANIDAASRLRSIPIKARGRYDTVASKLVDFTVVNIVTTY
jgi:hypothetical protein